MDSRSEEEEEIDIFDQRWIENEARSVVQAEEGGENNVLLFERGEQGEEGNPASRSTNGRKRTGRQRSQRGKRTEKRANKVLSEMNALFPSAQEGTPLAKVARREVGNVDSTENYVNRLRSYTEKGWEINAPKLSPRVCASHGWQLTERRMLSCSDCGAYIHVTLPDAGSGTFAAYTASVMHHIERILTGHNPGCIWRTSVYQEPLEPIVPKKILSAIEERYDNLERIDFKDFRIKPVPELTPRHLSKFDGKNAGIVQLAICHWEPTGHRGYKEIKCDKCQREVSLILFDTACPFNPLEQHHRWCPIFDDGREHCRWREQIEAVAGVNEHLTHLQQVMHITQRINETFRN
uniref:C3HC-type domain-containing protein n=1 Tax=Steinernema glaseri TaxID=37863 RepID=A0A1I8AS55_9BILA